MRDRDKDTETKIQRQREGGGEGKGEKRGEAHSCNLSTQEDSKFKANLGYTLYQNSMYMISYI